MSLKGIDVSYHQGKIDWNKVKNDGIEFAIIRAGYGVKQVDKKFTENIRGASAEGLKIGVYWFIYAADVNAAVRNADKCHETIRPYKDIISMKVWADWEYDSDKRNPQTKKSRTAIVKAFCERLKSYGYDVGVYANPDYLKSKFGDLSEYPLWLARYYPTMGDYSPIMWQYSSTGRVDGIKTKVDMNTWFGETETDDKPEEKPVSYYPVPDFTLIECLKQIKEDASFANRKKIATANDIIPYSGTAEQNVQIKKLLMEGKLIKP